MHQAKSMTSPATHPASSEVQISSRFPYVITPQKYQVHEDAQYFSHSSGLSPPIEMTALPVLLGRSEHRRVALHPPRLSGCQPVASDMFAGPVTSSCRAHRLSGMAATCGR